MDAASSLLLFVGGGGLPVACLELQNEIGRGKGRRGTTCRRCLYHRKRKGTAPSLTSCLTLPSSKPGREGREEGEKVEGEARSLFFGASEKEGITTAPTGSSSARADRGGKKKRKGGWKTV